MPQTSFLKKSALAVTALALAAGAAFAASHSAGVDPVKARIAAMKNVGFAASKGVPMLKGEAPFDANVAKLAIHLMQSSAYAFAGRFPEGATSEGASAKIWENKADFDAKTAKFVADLDAAVAADPKDEGAFKAAFGPVMQNCGSCHETYRVKKN